MHVFSPGYIYAVNTDKYSVLAFSHPQSVYSSRYIVPGDRQGKQQAPQFSVDAIVKHMLVGVVIWKRNTAGK